VLSDERLRANYDNGGKDGVAEAPKVDPSTLFAMIFGSEKFEPLVGELQLASQMQVGTDMFSISYLYVIGTRDLKLSDWCDSTLPFVYNLICCIEKKFLTALCAYVHLCLCALPQAQSEAELHPKLLALKQKKREINCALNLVLKLQPYIDSNGDEKLFRETVEAEAKELSSSAFGSTLLYTIGKLQSRIAVTAGGCGVCYVCHQCANTHALDSYTISNRPLSCCCRIKCPCVPY
jgi:hypothetical protein